MDARISDWRTRVVQPLRRIRRDLKSGIVPVDAQAAEALRSAIKRDELAAECVQQETLELEFPAESTGARAAPHTAAAANIAAYGVITALAGTLPDAPVTTLLKAVTEEFLT